MSFKKNVTLIAVTFAMLALLIIPASAAVLPYVNQGATVYIGESGLNINNAMDGNTRIGWWAPGAEISTTSPQQTIDVNGRQTTFEVTQSEFASYTGVWYRIRSDNQPNETAFYVEDPRLSISIYDEATDSSVDGKSIPIGQNLTFRIETNMRFTDQSRRFNNPDGTDSTVGGYINIKVKTESGTTYSALIDPSGNSQPLTGLAITKTPYYWNNSNSSWATGNVSNGQRTYQQGVYTVSAESTLNRMKDNYIGNFLGKSVSDSRTVTLGSDTLALTANRESVVRSKAFSVTVIGQPSTYYYLWVKGTQGMTGDEAPRFTSGQEGVTQDTSLSTGVIGTNFRTLNGQYLKELVGSVGYYAQIKTDTYGKRTVEFTTSRFTKAQKFTLHVEANTSPYQQHKTDEVGVTVSEGGMSIVASGDQSYYLGEEIKFSGINSESYDTYFFITGPNLPSSGGAIDSPRTAAVKGNPTTFGHTTTNSDNTWIFKWATSGVSLDAGTYTIYAVSTPSNRDDLSDSVYATVSIVIRKPFISASARNPTLAKGDKLTITGVAEGNPSPGIAVWVLGKNYATRNTESVNSDGSFKYELGSGDTTNLYAGQYFVVVQHPMQNGQFDIITHGDYVENLQLGTGTDIFRLFGSGSLQGSDAAEALIQAINNPNVDDTYTKFQFIIAEPFISLASIGVKHIGDKFTVTGTTNLAIDDEILMEIYSSSFKPTQKSQSGEFSGATGTVKVVASNTTGGLNEISYEVDAATFKPDEYIVTAQAVIQGTTGTTLFNVIEGTGTPTQTPTTTVPTTATPTPVVTEVVTVPPTPVITQVVTIPPTVIPGNVTTTTTQSPGFGALFALVGLACVAFIVVRRH